MHIFQPHKIVSVTLTEEGTLEVVRQYPSGICYGNGGRSPDTVKKEIYAVEGDRIELLDTIIGRHIPAHTVAEQIVF